jgi:3-oxoacyl-[acyl-carrier-protein] synthase II
MIAGIQGLGWVTAESYGQGGELATCRSSEGELPRLRGKQVFPEGHPRFGRLDMFSKTGFGALAFAMADAGWAAWQQKRRVGIVAATEYGCLQTDADYYDTVIPDDGECASPNLFAYTLPNCFLGEAALQFGLSGPTYVLNHRAGDELAGLRTAIQELHWEDLDGILAGVVNVTGPNVGPQGLPPGAVFLLLVPNDQDSTYGTLSLAADGTCRHNERVVDSWQALTEIALATRHADRDDNL